MRCLTCQYDLSNLPEHRCPECGRVFDPSNEESFISGSVATHIWSRLWTVTWSIAAMLAAWIVFSSIGLVLRFICGRTT